MKRIPAGGRVLALCLSAAVGVVTVAAMAVPAGAVAPRLVVSGARAAYDPPGSLELTLKALGLSVQISNGFLGASGPAVAVRIACALPLSETDGLGSLCLFSGDNETGEGLIFFPGDSVPASTCMYIYGTVANFGDNTNQDWDLGTVDGNCDNGGTVDALDQPGQDENVSPPIDVGAAVFQGNIMLGSPFPPEPNAAEFSF